MVAETWPSETHALERVSQRKLTCMEQMLCVHAQVRQSIVETHTSLHVRLCHRQRTIKMGVAFDQNDPMRGWKLASQDHGRMHAYICQMCHICMKRRTTVAPTKNDDVLYFIVAIRRHIFFRRKMRTTCNQQGQQQCETHKL